MKSTNTKENHVEYCLDCDTLCMHGCECICCSEPEDEEAAWQTAHGFPPIPEGYDAWIRGDCVDYKNLHFTWHAAKRYEADPASVAYEKGHIGGYSWTNTSPTFIGPDPDFYE